jgi:hypothetical protein
MKVKKNNFTKTQAYIKINLLNPCFLGKLADERSVLID